MEEKKKATSKTSTKKTTKKNTTKKESSTKKETKKKLTEKELLDELELEDEEVREQIIKRKNGKNDFDSGMSLGTKIAIVVVILVITILIILKGCVKTEYKVKFDTDGGTEISEQVVKKNEKASVPSDPTKEGYEFIGWYVGDEKYDFDSKVNSNLVIKAKWESINNAEVTGIELDQAELAIMPGDTAPLIAALKPDNAKQTKLVWSSDNEEAATVDENGLVTAKKNGKAVITVKTQDGAFEAKCTVVVSDNVVKVTAIDLNESAITIGVDESKKITASITPNDATNKGITWTSKDSSIATVNSNGVIVGKKEGTTTVTAKTKDGDYEARVNVTVKKISVTDISLNKTSLNLVEGNSSTLSATVLPKNAADRTVTWKSDNTSVATVDKNGKVTAVKEGTANIVVTSNDGNKKAECKVTVSKPVAVTGVKFDKTAVSIEEGKTAKITATVLPTNAANRNVRWSNSNSNVATISNGVITAKSVGTTTITVTTVDGEYTATCEVTVTEKPATYVMTLEGIKQEGTSAIAQYSVSFTRNGSPFTGYTGYNYNGKKSKSNTIAVGEVDTSVTNATITVNGQSFPATVTYK